MRTPEEKLSYSIFMVGMTTSRIHSLVQVLDEMAKDGRNQEQRSRASRAIKDAQKTVDQVKEWLGAMNE